MIYKAEVQHYSRKDPRAARLKGWMSDIRKGKAVDTSSTDVPQRGLLRREVGQKRLLSGVPVGRNKSVFYRGGRGGEGRVCEREATGLEMRKKLGVELK